LVLAAAEAARVATQSGVFRLRLSAESAAAEPLPLRGRRGRLSVLKLRYTGFEPEERLLAVATLEDTPEPLRSETVLSLLRGPLSEAAALSTRVTREELEEAIGEAAFLEEASVAAEEDQAFRQTIARLERSVEDRLLVLLARRGELTSRLADRRRQRADAAGSVARGRVEQHLEEDERALERMDAELERLRFRRDEDYHRVRRDALELRYAPPERQPVLEAEFVIE
jgi:hypothetical protein